MKLQENVNIKLGLAGVLLITVLAGGGRQIFESEANLVSEI